MYRERKGSSIYKSYQTKKDEGGIEAYVRRPIELYIQTLRAWLFARINVKCFNSQDQDISWGSAVLWYLDK